MSTPAIETKIELLTEAFESFALAIYAAKQTPGVRAHQGVQDAREETKKALREFLQPALRLAQ